MDEYKSFRATVLLCLTPDFTDIIASKRIQIYFYWKLIGFNLLSGEVCLIMVALYMTQSKFLISNVIKARQNNFVATDSCLRSIEI